VTLRVIRRFSRYARVFRVGIDDLDVLVRRPGIIFERRESWNQSTTERGNALFALVRRKVCLLEILDLFMI
jgi:hypothetical protein